MKTYIGTKIVNMKPMTRAEYNKLRGWQVPSDENPEDEGYLVEYPDGGKPNVIGYAGYISWSPKEQAEAAYRETTGMPFGLAIESLKKGLRVARAGWNGKGMWLRHIGSQDWQFDLGSITETEMDCEQCGFLAMKTADNKFVPWLASQTDMLADDWQIVV